MFLHTPKKLVQCECLICRTERIRNVGDWERIRADRAKEVPNRLYGVEINHEGDAV